MQALPSPSHTISSSAGSVRQELDMLATDLNKDPHPPFKPLPEGRGRVKLRPLRRRSRGERAPVKLGALCPRSGRGRA